MALEVDGLDQSQIILDQKLHTVGHRDCGSDEVEVLEKVLGPVYLLKADDFLLDVLIEVLLDHGGLKVDCLLNSQILFTRNHEHPAFKLGIQVEALKWPLPLHLRTLLPPEVLNLLLPHPEIIGDHLLLDVVVLETKPVMDATEWIDDA